MIFGVNGQEITLNIYCTKGNIMKIAICDDIPALHLDLKKCLEKYSAERRIDLIYDDYNKGADLLSSEIKYDLIFMDYQMDGLDGLETARLLRKRNDNTAIIFLTSYSDIVFDVFEVNAFRFLVKPIDMEKLTSAMDAYISGLDDSNYILLKTDDGNKRVKIDDIIYAEASDKYCYVRTVDDSLLYRNTLSEIEKLLPEESFFRSHRTYLVNMKHIVTHTATNIQFDNNECALISKLKLTPFKRTFTDYIKRHSLMR